MDGGTVEFGESIAEVGSGMGEGGEGGGKGREMVGGGDYGLVRAFREGLEGDEK